MRPGRAAPPAIVAERFTFRPDGANGPAPLSDLSFEAAPGKTLLVAGPTGSGKSTLLHLLAGLAGQYADPHAAGRLVVFHNEAENGHRPSAVPEPRPGLVGLLHQEPGDGLLGLDVVSALAFPLEQQGLPPGDTLRRVEDALQRFAILHLAARDVAALSGGEKKRAALAGLDALDPPLLLLDEPLSGLDPAGVRTVLEDLHRLRPHRTVVVAEHRTTPLRPLVDRTLHLLPREPARSGPAAPRIPAMQSPAPGIVARNLAATRGGRPVFAAVRLVLGAGVWGVLGPNGAGKTTLLETLAGLRAPDAGDVSVDGVPVWRDGRRPRRARRVEKTLRRRLQVTFQDPRDAFFAADVADEVAAGRRALRLDRRSEAREGALETLEEAGLSDLAQRSPLHLSVGEARCVALVSALAVGPRVLFLDEPTHGLDPAVRAALSQAIADFAAAGGLVVVATHEPDLLPGDADWMFLPGDGRVLVGDAARPGAPLPRAAGFQGGDTA